MDGIRLEALLKSSTKRSSFFPVRKGKQVTTKDLCCTNKNQSYPSIKRQDPPSDTFWGLKNRWQLHTPNPTSLLGCPARSDHNDCS